MLIDYLVEPAFSFFPLLSLERSLSQPELELRQEIVGGDESLDAMALSAVGVQLENRRGPVCLVALAEALKVGRVVFYVDSGGNEIARDEACDTLIRINLGIQPSTTASHRGRAEIEENRTLQVAGLV